MKILSLLILLSLILSTTFNGKVIKITDGDTIVVLTDNNEQIKIRLEVLTAQNQVRISALKPNKQPLTYVSANRLKLSSLVKINMAGL